MACIFLICIGVLAVLWDFSARRIPNALIAAGLTAAAAWQWSANGPPGLTNFFSGSMLPVLLLGGLHYFKMIGAGDLKYLMVVGGFLDLRQSLKCICISFLIAAVFSMIVVIKHRILQNRLFLLIQYIKDIFSTGVWRPYIQEKEDVSYLHLSLPIFLGSVLVTGGWI